MLCENCGKNEANVRYTQIINGKKREMNLCEECSEKLGIGNMSFKMPISFSSFLGDFFDEFEKDAFMPELSPTRELKCGRCGMTFDEFMQTGKFGCSNCYDAFEDRIDPMLKNMQGANRHIGRLGKVNQTSELKGSSSSTKTSAANNTNSVENVETKEQSELERLNNELKVAIKEERYEDAAKIRDKINEIKK